jgi:hypothetical protein
MVQVNLDFAKPLATQFSKCIDVLNVILFERKEKRMTGTVSVAITQVGVKARILLQPGPNSAIRNLIRSISVVRLEVIGNAKEDMNSLSMPRRFPFA